MTQFSDGRLTRHEAARLAETMISVAPKTERVFQSDLLEILEWYADQFCEHSKDFEGCGKLTDEQCAGCKARAALAREGK